MSSGVGAITSGEVVRLPQREAQAQRPQAPAARPAQPASLPPAEDGAFTVSTINQRLATLAAQRAGRELDITA